MSIPTSPVEEFLVQHAAEAVTGVVDVRSGKKRWLIYFDQGALVGTQSNIKSEQAAALRAKRALSDDELAHIQAAKRFKNVCSVEITEVTFKSGTPKSNGPTCFGRALFRGVGAARDEEQRATLAAETLEGRLTYIGDGPELGIPEAIMALLQALDGSNTGRAAIAKVEPDSIPDMHLALWMAERLGHILVEAPAAKKDKDAQDDDDDDDDFAAAMLSAMNLDNPVDAEPAEPEPEIAEKPAAQRPKKKPKGGAATHEVGLPGRSQKPAPAAAKTTSTHEVGLPGRSKTPAPAAAKPAPAAAKPAPAEPTVTAAAKPAPAEPTVTAAAAPAEHPLAQSLRELAARIEGTENHFEVLGIPWESSEDEFRKAHLKLAQNLHPDRYSDAPPEMQDQATEVFDKVRAAWEVLGDEESRRKYIDKVIHGKKTEEELAMEQVEAYWKAEADFKKGMAAFNAGRLVKAHELFSSAVDAADDQLEFAAYLGFTTFSLNQTRDPEEAEKGAALLKDCIDQNSKQERKLDSAWVLLGKVYLAKEEAKLAKKCFIQALKINTTNGDAVREMRRLTESERSEKKSGLFGGLFGKKEKAKGKKGR